MSNKFCERLKELRTDKNLLQSELAEKLGLSKATVSAWETGRNQPSFDMLITLSDFFGVSIDFLLGKTDY